VVVDVASVDHVLRAIGRSVEQGRSFGLLRRRRRDSSGARRRHPALIRRVEATPARVERGRGRRNDHRSRQPHWIRRDAEVDPPRDGTDAILAAPGRSEIAGARDEWTCAMRTCAMRHDSRTTAGSDLDGRVAGATIRTVRATNAVTLVLIAGACNDHATLAELSNKHLDVHVHVAIATSVDLYYYPVAGACPTLDQSDLNGTFGGWPLTFVSLRSAPGPMMGETDCFAEFEVPFDTMPSNGVVTVTDQSQEILATFEQTALERRTVTHPTWSFRLGEVVTLQWSHAADLVGPGVLASVSLDPTVPLAPATIAPPTGIMFTVPASYPTGALRAYVGIRPATYVQSALECLNASPCTASPNYGYEHDATVSP
jgi:hypothetical protein